MCDPRWSDWKRIPGFSQYAASPEGCIMRWKGRLLMKSTAEDSGHLAVTLVSDTNERKRVYVHRMILLTFRGPPPDELSEGCHGNSDPSDNRLKNLRWDTKLANRQDRVQAEAIEKGYF